MQYFVMKKAREIGCTVLLDGQGRDESLFGYEGYYAIYFALLINDFKFFKFIKEFYKFESYKINKKQVFKSIISTLFGFKLQIVKNMFRKNIFKEKYRLENLNHIFMFKNFKDFQIRELMVRNLPQLLKYEDRNSMRHSVETRLPFIDYKFVENAISINDSVKFKNGYLKYVLRKIVDKILPSNIVWRKNKFGFEAPTDLLLNHHKDEMISTIEKSKIVNHFVNLNNDIYSNKKLLWKMYNIAVWEEIYRVKI